MTVIKATFFTAQALTSVSKGCCNKTISGQGERRKKRIAAGLSPSLSGRVLAGSTTLLRNWPVPGEGGMRQQDLRATDMWPSSAGNDTRAKLVDDSKSSSNLALGTTIAGRTARLLLDWLKPSSHVSHSRPTCLAITLTGKEIVEFIHEYRQPGFPIMN